MKFRFDEIAFNSTLKKKPVEEDKIHYIGLEHIEPGNFSITEWGSDVAPVGEKLIMKKGDILFGKRRAYQRKVAIAPFDGIFSAHGMVLRPKTDVIDADFFPLFISSDTFMETAMRISVGGLSPTINWKDLKEQEFELPSLEEQQTIAKKAWAAYRLKEAYQRLLVATDEMVKSQFLEWFGSPEIGWKYPTKTLGELYPIGTGGTPERESGNYYGGDIPWVKSTEVNFCHIVETQEHITKEGLKASNCKPYNPNTVLLAMYGQGSTRGKVAILNCKATVNQAIAAIQVDNPDDSEFVFQELKCMYEHVRDLASGGNQHNLNLKIVSNIHIAIAPPELKSHFVEIARQADKSKFELKRAIEAIDKVIKSLING